MKVLKGIFSPFFDIPFDSYTFQPENFLLRI
jgi:hypothetical protein